MSKTFDLIVEGKSDDPTKVAPNALHLKNLVWDGDSPPDIVRLEGGMLLVKMGRYASEGDKIRYYVPTVAELVEGRLKAL